MPSKALTGLLDGLSEIDALQRANPTPQQGSGLTRPKIVRALGRAELVLLSSHFERYIYALTDESIEYIISRGVTAKNLPDEVRLLQARQTIDLLAQTSWDRRAEKLQAYSKDEASLWVDDAVVTDLDAEKLLAWMKSPKCKSIVRAFRIWGIQDIFSAITRTAANRQALWLRIGELVDKRNNIAHGDLTTEARYLDVVQYRSAVKRFCVSADKIMSRTLARRLGGPRPW